VVVGDPTSGHLKIVLTLFRELMTKGQTLKGGCSRLRDGKFVKMLLQALGLKFI